MTERTRLRMTGPLAGYAQGFFAELLAQGYKPNSAADQVRLMAHVSRWLQSRRLGAHDLTPRRLTQFLRARRRAGYTLLLTHCGLRPLLGYLRRLQVAPAPPLPVARTALDRVLARYRDYLLHERGLAPDTIRCRQAVSRRFLRPFSLREQIEFDRLTVATVTRFLLHDCRDRSVGYTKGVVTALRSLLRFLYLEGLTPTQLDAAVPAVAGWRLTSLPRALEPRRVARLLHSCDRRTATGRRDYAILMLLVRLGLRAGEVAALELEDLDWQRGEIVIHGKRRQDERLPLPPDVGKAVVAYLRRGRPRGAYRRVFLRRRAPRGPLARSGVSSVVSQACRRAGMPRVGPHRLRHTAATRMLDSGASLPEIAQVLRHRSLLTTAIYAKVDHRSLRALAQPWPGGNP